MGNYDAEYYLKNKEKIAERNRIYYQTYREERLAYQNDYNRITDAERKYKNKVRYWATRDSAKKAKPPPADYPVAYVPASFSVVFS